jgi:hypothetical protein
MHPTFAGLADDVRIGGWVRSLQPERPMRTMPVVMSHVDSKDSVQVRASHDQQPVQALGTDRADKPFCDGVRVGRLDRCQPHLGALRAEEVVEGAAELRVAIAQ